MSGSMIIRVILECPYSGGHPLSTHREAVGEHPLPERTIVSVRVRVMVYGRNPELRRVPA